MSGNYIIQGSAVDGGAPISKVQVLLNGSPWGNSIPGNGSTSFHWQESVDTTMVNPALNQTIKDSYRRALGHVSHGATICESTDQYGSGYNDRQRSNNL
jgi:hypothetical protein